MDQIFAAIADYIDDISIALSTHFKRANEVLGIDFYQTDLSVMTKHVGQRIGLPDSPFKYFVMVNGDGSFIGVVNTLLDGKRGEILLITFANDVATEERVDKLLEYAMSRLRESGAQTVQIEVDSSEPLLQSAVKRKSGRLLSEKYAW